MKASNTKWCLILLLFLGSGKVEVSATTNLSNLPNEQQVQAKKMTKRQLKQQKRFEQSLTKFQKKKKPKEKKDLSATLPILILGLGFIFTLSFSFLAPYVLSLSSLFGLIFAIRARKRSTTKKARNLATAGIILSSLMLATLILIGGMYLSLIFGWT